MTNTITQQANFIPAARSNDVLGVDDTSDLSGVGSVPKTKKIMLEQVRHYDNIGSAIPLQKFHAKMELMKTGGSNVRILFLMDSTGVGKGSTSGSDKWGHNPSTVFSNYLLNNGINSTTSAFFGNGDGTNASTYNPRLVVGNVWTGADDTIGGSLQTASANTNAISYTPTEQWDTAKVWYATIPSSGVLSLDVDGSGTVTQDTAASAGMSSKTITTTLGIHTLNIKWSSGGNIYIIGAELTNSAVSQVQILNASVGGLKTETLVEHNNLYNPIGAAQTLTPDLTIFGTVINDWGNTVDLTIFETNVQTLITNAQVTGDAAWLISVPTANAQVPLTTQAPYVAVIRKVCAANNVPVIDIYDRFQTYEISQPLNLYSDNVHENGPGYGVAGKAIFDMLNVKGYSSFIPSSAIISDTSGPVDAPAGFVGQIINSTVAIGSATSLTTATAKTITSITLAPGDYDLWGNIGFIANTGTIPTVITGSINTTTNAQATSPNGGAFAQLGATLGTASTNVLPVGAMRVKPVVVTTYYLVATSAFSVSTMTAYGSLSARLRC